MKKLIIFFILTVITTSPGLVLAEKKNSNLFEYLSNAAALEDYKAFQSLSGRGEIESGDRRLSFSYRLNINSAVHNVDSESSSNRVNGYLKIFNHKKIDSETPFREMMVNFSGSVIGMNDVDLYFKLDKVIPTFVEATEELTVKTQFLRMFIAAYTGDWYYLSLDSYNNGGSGSELDQPLESEEHNEFRELFKTNSEEAILKMVEKVVLNSNEPQANEYINEILDTVKLIFNSNIFTQRKIVSGGNKGYTFFNLNKGGIINLMKEIGKVINEAPIEVDLGKIRELLSSFSFSGIYGVNEQYNLIDNLALRFKIKDTSDIKNFNLNYRYKLSNLGKKVEVKAPKTFLELSDLNLLEF